VPLAGQYVRDEGQQQQQYTMWHRQARGSSSGGIWGESIRDQILLGELVCRCIGT
jgi:hypothetical protein